jgi:hypothetical protein
MISRHELRNRIILLTATVILTIVAAEMACRVLRGTWFLWHWPNLVLLENDPNPKPCMFVPDDKVGYVPERDCRGPEHGHDAEGLRAMPAPPSDVSPDAPFILVTGDSYAYADEVKDDETWAAYLQAMVHRKIRNGGVPGYGLDQSVLRTEELAPRFKPGLIVLAFIPDDLHRSEMHRLYGAEKPYFTLKQGELQLQNTPVPIKPLTAADLPFWQRWFGWSMFVDKYMRHFGHYPDWFLLDAEATPPGTGEKLECPLMQKVAALKIPTLVVAQYRPHMWTYGKKWADEQQRLSQSVLKCAAESGLQTYDTFGLVDAALKTQGVNQLYGEWHHSAAGNKLVAEGIAAELLRLKLLP